MGVDRKRKVSPLVPDFVREHVHSVGRLIRESDGEAASRLVMAALRDFPTLNRIAPYLWRDYAFGTHAWIGHREHDDLEDLISPIGRPLSRLSIRFVEDDWASLDALGFALGRPVAHACAALLRFAHDYPRVTQLVAPNFELPSVFRLKEGLAQWQ